MKPKIIFFGNGMLADYALKVLERRGEIIFHARTKDDLEEVKAKKRAFPEAHGVLASYGVMIRQDVLDLFEPEGILNIHPSKLPKYRGASPIETAILSGDKDFSVSVMKLVSAMDAGPLYYQETIKGLPLQKDRIYQALAENGAEWIGTHLNGVPETPQTTECGETGGQDFNTHFGTRPNVLPTPRPQQGEPTFTTKLEKSMGLLNPSIDTAEELYLKIVAYQGFPKPKFAFYGQKCIILEAIPLEQGKTAPLELEGRDGAKLAILRLQPEGKKPMDAKSFLNGYAR